MDKAVRCHHKVREAARRAETSRGAQPRSGTAARSVRDHQPSAELLRPTKAVRGAPGRQRGSAGQV